MRLILFWVPFLFYFSSLQAETIDPVGVKPPTGKVPSGLLQMGDNTHYNRHVVIADKSRRTLTVWKNLDGDAQLIDYFPMDHGKKNGNKQVQGDHKTPEGIYFVQKKKEAKELDYNEYGVMAFTLDYPNFFDRLDKKTGGGIWLHSIPPTKTLKRGSRGCVVVREKVIKKIDSFIKLDQKTPVLVYERVHYVAPKRLKSDRKKVNKWLNQWKSAWISQDIDRYMRFYSKNFLSAGKNHNAWQDYKKSINDNNTSFSVRIKKPIFYRNKDQIVVRFLQEYSSDRLSDYGEKTLFIHLENNKLRIVNESWQAEKQKPLASIKL